MSNYHFLSANVSDEVRNKLSKPESFPRPWDKKQEEEVRPQSALTPHGDQRAFFMNSDMGEIRTEPLILPEEPE